VEAPPEEIVVDPSIRRRNKKEEFCVGCLEDIKPILMSGLKDGSSSIRLTKR